MIDYLRGCWARLRYVLLADVRFYPDDPEMDCTDLAHPAWWRAERHTCDSLAQQLVASLEGKCSWQVSPCKWHVARARLDRLVKAARAAGIVP